MKIISITFSGIVTIAIIIGSLIMSLNASMNQIRNLVISQIELSKIADGAYKGEYHKGRWSYDLIVTLANHKIVKIQNINKRMEMYKGFNQKAAEEIIKKQSPQIDVVTGATIHTKAFSKAVEDALRKGQQS